MYKFVSVLMVAALGACIPIIVPVPISAPQGEVRMLAAHVPQDVLFDQFLANARTQESLGGLAFNADLSRVAQAHAQDMVTRGYFSHVSPEGVDSGARAAAAGLPVCGIGENIAQGQRTSAEAFEGWMASGPHRKNILNGRMASYGFGQAGETWVLMLYAPC